MSPARLPADYLYVNHLDALWVRRAIFLAAGGVAVFLSYVAVMSGTASDTRIGSISIAAMAFPGLVSGFVMTAYIAWETRNVRIAKQQADELNAQLVRKEIELGRIATLDELTRLYSRREFENSLRLEFERRRRYGRELSLLLIDVEGAGELAGNLSKTYLLSEVSVIFRHILRANDLGGRYTNDVLSLLLPETDSIRAQLVADKIRAAVAANTHIGTLPNGSPRVSVSIGIAVADESMPDYYAMREAAESALADAIAGGVSQVRVYEPPPAEEEEEAGPYRLAS